jgi:hypothetical protein
MDFGVGKRCVLCLDFVGPVQDWRQFAPKFKNHFYFYRYKCETSIYGFSNRNAYGDDSITSGGQMEDLLQI